MKRKLISLLAVMVLAVTTLTGCGETKEASQDVTQENVPDTVAYRLRSQFRAEIASNSDIVSVAENLNACSEFKDLSMATMPVEEGYLNGFNEEIKGFKSGVMFAPMIGSIPFVGYIFETDNPEELVKVLEKNAMLNWNICTVADEKVTDVQGNYVFFVMAPTSFDME